MSQLSFELPQLNTPDKFADPKIVTAFTSIQTWANGSIDQTNLSSGVALSAGLNREGVFVKGWTSISAEQTREVSTFGTLTTPDQVEVTLPEHGLIRIGYQATWKESVEAAARAAIFLGSNQLKSLTGAAPAAPAVQETSLGASQLHFAPLYTWSGGLASATGATEYTGDVTTGQVVGGGGSGTYANGLCVVFAAPGTYNVSVQFKASSGKVTAKNRKLWVEAVSFI